MLALSRRLGDNSALNYAYWNVALNYVFRGLMREAREPRSTLLSPRCTRGSEKLPSSNWQRTFAHECLLRGHELP